MYTKLRRRTDKENVQINMKIKKTSRELRRNVCEKVNSNLKWKQCSLLAVNYLNVAQKENAFTTFYGK